MTNPTERDTAIDPQSASWVEAGRRFAPQLGGRSAIVIIGEDPAAAASVALGIGQALTIERRVAIADLVGEVEPLQALVTSDDPHGIADIFLYGISPDRIAHPVDESGNLFIMPSGTEPVQSEEIYRSPRWRRLASGFREVGALLILVGQMDAPALDDLIEQCEGAVLVGPKAAATAPVYPVLGRIEHPVSLPTPRLPRVPTRPTAPKWRGPAIAAGILALAGAAMWAKLSDSNGKGKSSTANTASPSPRAKAETPSVAPPTNPGDSAAASGWAVAVSAANTADGARAELKKNAGWMPAGTVSPVPFGPSREIWYKIVAGAYATRAGADSLLQTLRNTKVIGDPLTGSVINAPLAFLIDTAGSRGKAGPIITRYTDMGVSVYPLVQPNGSVRIYAGAFEKIEQTTTLASALRAAGLKAELVYRTGRSL
jgi:hypothetical protein